MIRRESRELAGEGVGECVVVGGPADGGGCEVEFEVGGSFCAERARDGELEFAGEVCLAGAE